MGCQQQWGASSGNDASAVAMGCQQWQCSASSGNAVPAAAMKRQQWQRGASLAAVGCQRSGPPDLEREEDTGGPLVVRVLRPALDRPAPGPRRGI